jgi:hypothetical protein
MSHNKVWMIYTVEDGKPVCRPLTQERVNAVRARARKPRKAKKGGRRWSIEDDVKGKVLIPCDGNATCRAFDAVFPGTLRGGTFHNDGIQGERIYYELDSVGVLKSFAPVDSAPLDMIEEYDRQSAPSKKGTFAHGGFLPPDHPLYGAGPIVSGRPLSPPPKKTHWRINEIVGGPYGPPGCYLTGNNEPISTGSPPAP